ncbi:MAG: TIGR04255 family protein [Myxococcota bacterium]
MEESPHFTRPPVEEVAMSVQFTPLTALTTAQVARYWEGVRERFPRWNEAPPIDAVVEMFGAPKLDMPRFILTVEGGVLPHRALFENELGTELVQVQRDRFVRNWRRHGNPIEYPRYKALRERFKADLDGFIVYASEGGLGVPAPNQCEITYVNHIPAGEGWQSHSDLHRVFRPLRESAPRPENIDMTLNYVFPWPGEELPAGRLHVQITSVHRVSDGVPLIAATLVARGRPRSQNSAGVLQWLDVGHAFLVDTFASLTTIDMHKLWGRQDVR